MQKLFPKPPRMKPPAPVLPPNKAPDPRIAINPNEGAANIGSEDSNMASLTADSLIRVAQRRPEVTRGKRTLLGG